MPTALRLSSFSVSAAKSKWFRTPRPRGFVIHNDEDDDDAAARLHEKVKQVMLLSQHSFLKLTNEGCGGVYIISGHESDLPPIGVFKPRDEEYMTPNNPRGYHKDGVIGKTEHPIHRGFRIGNGAIMERAAYVLDQTYDHFCGVPTTCLTTLSVNGRKTQGSLQSFVSFDASAEDMGTLVFDVAQVQRIGILDIRLFNTDRHAGNILLSRQEKSSAYKMTPIDHGFCLPSYEHLESATFDWLRWPQAVFPFNPEASDHIASIDVERDAKLLRNVGVREESITTFRLCSYLLKIGASAGRSLHDIASMLIRHGDGSQPSSLEIMIFETRDKIPSKCLFPSERAYGDTLVQHLLNKMPPGLLWTPKNKKPQSVAVGSVDRKSVV